MRRGLNLALFSQDRTLYDCMLAAAMYQAVIDTNVLVSALLSNRGASHRLLRMVGDDRWQFNLSVPLVLEYEQTLKRIAEATV